MKALLGMGVAGARGDDAWVLQRALLAYLLLWSGIWLSGYRFLDDRGRSVWGALGWENNGRPLTTLVMRLFTRDGQLLDTTPLPQLLAIVLMALTLVVLRRQLQAPPRWSWLACALVLFATPLFIENMAFRFDAFSMSLAMLGAVLAAGALRSSRPYLGIGLGAGWLAVVLMLYQPAVNVFVALCCLHGGLAARQAGPARLWHDLWRALAALALGLLLYYPVMQHFLPEVGYSAHHAERFGLAALPAGAWHNLLMAWQKALGWLYPAALLALGLLLGMALVGALRGATWQRRWPVLACLALSPLALFGLMLALVNPIWQPRAFVGLGGVVACWTLLAWHLGQGAVWQRLVGGVASIYLATVLLQAWLFGGLTGELHRHEEWLLRDIADRVNAEYRQHGRDQLVIEGNWAWPPVAGRSRQHDPLMRTLLPRGLQEGDYWNEPALDLRGLFEEVVVTTPQATPPGARQTLLYESRYYRLWWDGERLVLSLQG